MQTVRSREHAGGFRLGSWDVERLVQALGGDEKVTHVAVELSDGTTLQLTHAGEIVDIANADARAIVGLSVESAPAAFLATTDDPSRLVLVRLLDRTWGPVSWYVSGDERAVQRLSRSLADWVASVTPWYGRIATAPRVALAVGSLLVLALLAVVALALYLIAGGDPRATVSATPVGLAAVRGAASGALLLLAATAVVANLRRDRMFPVAQFLVGAGDERERRFARRRRWLLGAGGVAAILAAAGSVVAGLGV
jgi:hypothetical protein